MVMRTPVVKLRSAGGGGGGAGGGHCSWELRLPGGRRVCRLRVALLALRLPCGRGALRVGNELLCGGHLGARTLHLPADTRAVPVHYSSVSPNEDDFEALLRLEACDEAGVDAVAEATTAEGRVVSDGDCGGLFPVSQGEPVGLLSPGYPARYPHNKNCLFVLEQRPATKAADGDAACFLDLDFVDFHLASPSASCGAGDRLLVEGVEGAAGGVGVAFCGERSGVTRLPLLPPAPPTRGQPGERGQQPGVRVRFLSDAAGTAAGFRVLATLSPCQHGQHRDQERREPLMPADMKGLSGHGNDSSSGKSLAGIAGIAGLASASLGLPFPAFPAYPAQLPRIQFPAPSLFASFRFSAPQCCGRVHAGPQLFLTSPGFPSGLASGWSSDCVYPVARQLPQTCRLRLVLHHFLLLGTCDKHFLEVGGRRLCGCQSGAQIVSYFRPGEVTQLLRYSRHLLSTGAFIIEVRQEGCGAPALPGGGFGAPGIPGGYPGIPGIPGLPWRARSTDASNGAALLLPVCGAPSYKDWLAGAAAWAGTVPSALLQCPVGVFPFAKCRELRALAGVFTSPRYPDPYPNNARVCYRFPRYPEQCSLEVTFLDFDLEPSPTCNKDYVSLGGATRYCGNTLASTLVMLSFQDSQYVDVLFISDNAINGRGFRANFRQLPCTPVAGPRPLPVEQAGPYQDSGQPERPPLYPEPTTPSSPRTPPPPPRTAPPPTAVCGGDVRQQQFALSSLDVAGHPECEFTVRRVSEDICGLQVLVERMALDCQREHVVVGGSTLCGQKLAGRTVTVDFLGDAVRMVYQGFAEGVQAAQADFLIHVQQVADCLDLDVTPVARFGKAAPDDVSECVVVLDGVLGHLEAPALQPRSPHHLSCSYVFRRRPGRCVLRLDFHDFAIASGPECTESYLALRNHKYCGTDLARTTHGLSFAGATIELPYRLHKDVPSARWNVSYAQLPC
ncbi:uncharacterized protein LOC117639702 [Thrips palmi]|uniref:Uncharacterized protein LOC117639702 n=1 Tax=Thrips palmi TaxID=161013 RepID=A0A6P8XWP6_THRPL|nr:uncharacterized protein LOC117639702 [Thrips palmi]